MKNEKDENLEIPAELLDDNNINLNTINNALSLDNLNFEDPYNDLSGNNITGNVKELGLNLTDEQIKDFYDYLAGNKSRPLFADKYFADADERIKESNQLTTMLGLSFVPKLLSAEQSLINSLCSDESLKFISDDERLSRLQTLATISIKLNESAMKYNKESRDIGSIPSIYRQLLDKLIATPPEKVDRLKVIPDLLELSEDRWSRLIELLNK